jgi:hypothetical protein
LAYKDDILETFTKKIGLTPKKRRYELNQAAIQSLHILAEREQRNEEDLAAELLSFALAQREMTDQYMENWKRLSEREQQIGSSDLPAVYQPANCRTPEHFSTHRQITRAQYQP